MIDAHADFAEDLPHVEVELDLAAARGHGLKPGDVRRQSSTLLASEEVGDIFIAGQGLRRPRLERARPRATASPTSSGSR